MSALIQISRLFFGILFLGLSLVFSAQAQTPAQTQTQTQQAPEKKLLDKQSEYRLAAGDLIKITVFQNPDLTMDVRIPESGVVSYPLIGAVPLGGLTPADAEKYISYKLREGEFVQKPQVNVLVVEVKGNLVSVLGMVNRPGRFPIETGDTKVSDMLAMAGGATIEGADVVVLSGIRNGKAFRNEIDMPAMLNGNAEQDLTVAGGDTIFVRRAPVFYVYGEAQRPGAYRLERSMTVLQGLAQGGGLTLRGTERNLKIHRKGPDGKITIIPAKKTDLLQPEDVIYVDEGTF
jgi:polysaccharide biosynthesis/export protein